MRRFADPERQGRAVDIDALTRIDLALAIQRQMIGILRDDHAGDCRLGWHAAFDQAQFGGCLHDASCAGPAGILWTAGHDDTELCRHDIQPFADVFADDVTFRAAAAGDIGCNDLFDAR